MMIDKLIATFTIGLTLIGAPARAQQAPAAAPTPPPPLVRENATVKLTDHVWAIPDFNVGGVPNVGIIVGSKATLIVDTGMGPANGEAIVREMQKVSKNADVYVVTTHYHPEHSLGMSAFKGAKLVMTKIQQQDMAELGKQIQDTFAKRSAVNAKLLDGVPYPTADIYFDRDHRLDLGGVHARLMWRGPATLHTRGDTMIWVEEDRVLFTGDVVMSQRFLAAQTELEPHGLDRDARRARRIEACARRARARQAWRRDPHRPRSRVPDGGSGARRRTQEGWEDRRRSDRCGRRGDCAEVSRVGESDWCRGGGAGGVRRGEVGPLRTFNPSRRPAFVWLVLLICGVYAGFFAFTTYVSARHYGSVKARGWMNRATDTGWIVSEVDEAGAAAGRLERGDRLLAIDGDDRSAILGYSILTDVRGGDTYRVDVERHGQRVSVDVLLPLVGGRYLWPIFQVCSLAFFLCGAVLGFLRPQDGQVRFVSVLLMSVGFTSLQEALGAPRLFLVGWERSAHLALAPVYLFFAPMTYHFFSRFPTWRRPGSPWRSIQWVLYALLVLVFGPARVLSFMGFLEVSEGSSRFLAAHPWLFLAAARLDRWVYAYMGVCLMLALVVAARNYRHLPDRGSRRRSRWVMASLITACGPVGITFASETTVWVSRATWELVYPLTFLAMLAIPASIATAVWKEQLFDVRVVVRRGLQYLLARAALRTLLALPIALLVFSIVSNPNRTVAEILTQGSGWVNLLLIGAIAATLQSRQRLQASLDRRFFARPITRSRCSCN